MSLSNSKTGGTYYALNSRVLTWNFNKNTVSSISATSRSCTIWNTSASCTITTPTITAQTRTSRNKDLEQQQEVQVQRLPKMQV